MKKILFISLILLGALLSCRRSVVNRPDTIPLVKSLAADTTIQFKNPGAAGSIAVLGAPDDVSSLVNYLATLDEVDNIDGHGPADSLPDFAGERFLAVMDTLFRTDSTLRRQVIVQAWAAVRGAEDRPKLYIFATPGMSAFDLDTLYKMRGGQIPIIAAEDSLAIGRETSALLRRDNLFTHRIAYPEVQTIVADVPALD